MTYRSAEVELIADRWPPVGRRRGLVLLLHGAGQTRHSWADTARALSTDGWDVVSLDARGHGDSSWASDGTYTLDAFVGDLLAVLSGLAEPPVLVGASLGGLTALVAEGERGPLARALVLVDVVPRLEVEGVERIRDFMQSTSGGFDSLASAAEAVRAYNPSRQRPVRSANGLVKNLRQGADGRFQWHWDPALLDLISLESSGAVQRRCEAAAARITTPTLLLRGAQSDIVSDAGVAELRTLIRGAETSDVQGTGHMVAGDDNAAFTSRVLDFLASLSTTDR
ncbi:alpha/beta fold hydrolase [Sporichthya polymorpha]|uniref:alpha/beta fold hydrolase n=1 Tax=Sporichthya polymorpha TaxID=35751 RepID=UPI00036F10B2|nr:alpha/beta hydrolase [Sporichthya polymorpha]